MQKILKILTVSDVPLPCRNNIYHMLQILIHSNIIIFYVRRYFRKNFYQVKEKTY